MGIKFIRVVAFVVFGLLAGGAARASDSNLIEPRLTVPLGGADRPHVALTLDACSGKTDERILAALVENRIPATFFVTARWIGRNPAAMSVLLQHPDLFEIENHGARHVPAIDRVMSVYGIAAAGSPEAVRAEVGGGAEAIRAATGHSPAWFRGATALYTQSSLALIHAMHFTVAGYSIAADGGALLGTRMTAQRIGHAHDGDVILAHVNHPEKPAGSGVVEGILELKARGFRFVRLDGTQPAEAPQGGSRPQS